MKESSAQTMFGRKHRRHGRLYLHIYFAFIGIVVLFCVLTALLFFVFDDDDDELQKTRAASLVVAALLPGPDAPLADLQAAVAHWSGQLDVDLTVRDADDRVLAAAGPELSRPGRRSEQQGWVRMRHGKLTAGVRLPDGRWAILGHDHPGGGHWLWALVVLAVAIGVGAHPLARRITRRLERLRVGVDELGSGDLGARVEVEGRDEVAELARSFNQAAERIETLVQTQTSMLAGASHELRSPLTRIRMAVELLTGDERPELRARIGHDIQELDELIEELLAASRFQVSTARAGELERVDLLVLAAEEAARVGAEVEGAPAPFHGEARWLSRLMRNLLENARRHSGGERVRMAVTPMPGGVRLTVEDDGEGVPEALRERIFEPFFRPAGMRESRDRGVGLGLALVRQIARRHGGDAHVESREEGGSRFVVELRESPKQAPA